MRAVDWAGRHADWNPPLPPGSRPRPDSRRVLEEVRRLELCAVARLEKEPMDNFIDTEKVERIRALHAEGKSNAEVAAEVGCGRTTVRKYLSGPTRPTNGHGANHSAGLAEVERLLNDRWQKLSVVERLRVFLK